LTKHWRLAATIVLSVAMNTVAVSAPAVGAHAADSASTSSVRTPSVSTFSANASSVSTSSRNTRTYKHSMAGKAVTPQAGNYSGPPDISCTDSALYFIKTGASSVYADKGDGCNGTMSRIQIELELAFWSPFEPADWLVFVRGDPRECFSCASLLTSLSTGGLSPQEYRVRSRIIETAPSGYIPSGWIGPYEYAYVVID
jgi:hypothetical protein